MEEHRLTSEKIQAYDHWLRHEERAPGTIEKYLRDIRAFAACLDGKAVTREAVAEWKEDLLAEMEKAKQFIFLEYYIASKGQIWDRICEVLTERAAAGVEVNLILDDFGSMMTMPPEEIDALRQKGIWVQMFNPVHQYVNRLYFNYRDHRKIAVIDGDIAYTGGANLADEYANLIVRFGYWKDCGLRLKGEGAWGFTRQFMHLWLRMSGELRDPWDSYRPRGGGDIRRITAVCAAA